MLTVAYLANQFPAAVEPYVGEEIQELRRRGVQVIAGSVRRAEAGSSGGSRDALESEILCLQPVRVLTLLRALGLVVRRWGKIADLVARVLLRGKESPKRRVKALLHTWLGAYYAVLLEGRGVKHVHVHHGYFGSWIGMVAARLLGVSFSMTLHGSDLLVNRAYLDTKLRNCRFCVTISEYNRRYILEHFPGIQASKIVISRLGVDVPKRAEARRVARGTRRTFTLLAVGRLHAVKDHAFLVRACSRLRDGGFDFECVIAGEGPGAATSGVSDPEAPTARPDHSARPRCPGADGCTLRARRCGCAYQPKRRNSAGADGSDDAGQNRAGAGDHGDPGNCDSRKNWFSLRAGSAAGFCGKDFVS